MTDETTPKPGKKKLTHIKLTSHPERGPQVLPIKWGASTAVERGPIVGTVTNPSQRNVIGAHSGSYGRVLLESWPVRARMRPLTHILIPSQSSVAHLECQFTTVVPLSRPLWKITAAARPN